MREVCGSHQKNQQFLNSRPSNRQALRPTSPRALALQLCSVLSTGFVLLVTLALLDRNAAAWASTSTNLVKSPEQIYKQHADAVVRIEVRLHKQIISTGSGIIVSRDGEVLTSQHVVRPLLHHPQAQIQVRSRNQKSFADVRIGHCTSGPITQAVDLCHLKVHGLRSSRFLTPSSRRPSPGESVSVIGHPRGLDYSITTGIVSGLRPASSLSPDQGSASKITSSKPFEELQFEELRFEELQIDAAINPGNSGGPIFGKQGDLIGLVYQTERNGQNISFGLSAKVLREFLGKSKLLGFRKLQSARTHEVQQVAKAADAWIAEQITPRMKSWTNSTEPAASKSWRWTHLSLGRKKLRALLPTALHNCLRLDAAATSAASPDSETRSSNFRESATDASACVSSAGEWQLSIQSRSRANTSAIDLMRFRNRHMVESRPLLLVSELERESRWDQLPKRLHRDFYSRPSVAQCLALDQNSKGQRRLPIHQDSAIEFVTLQAQSLWRDALAVCRYQTQNDQEPGAVSSSIWIETPQNWFEISIWSAHPAHRRLTEQLADFIALSLIEVPAPQSPLPAPYQSDHPRRGEPRASVGLKAED